MFTTTTPTRLIASLGFALFATTSAQAGTFGYYCRSEVNCNGLFNDLVTDRYTDTYKDDKWMIYVQADTYTFGDGSGAAHAIVGVSLKSKGKYVNAPAKTFSYIQTKKQVGNAYQKQELERATIRSAVESMMAACADGPKCVLE